MQLSIILNIPSVLVLLIYLKFKVFNFAKIISGEILFNGNSVTKLKTHQLMNLGISYVSQGKINFSNLTVKENLEIGNDHLDNLTICNRINYVYDLFPVLMDKKNKLAFTLSGGQQQMLAIGRALVQKPKLLLLYEPSLGLSPLLQKELFKTIQKLRDLGLAILIVEQNAKKAIQMADRTYLLEDGKVAFFNIGAISNLAGYDTTIDSTLARMVVVALPLKAISSPVSAPKTPPFHYSTRTADGRFDSGYSTTGVETRVSSRLVSMDFDPSRSVAIYDVRIITYEPGSSTSDSLKERIFQA